TLPLHRRCHAFPTGLLALVVALFEASLRLSEALVSASRRQRSRCASALPDAAGIETPSKIRRPLKRRRRAGSNPAPFASSFLTPIDPTPPSSSCCGTWAWAGVAAGTGEGALAELALAESLALLEAPDIMRAAAVCQAWRGVAECKALWALVSPRLSLVDRIIQRSKLSTRR
ncbi:unnamed protein product, partial [Polarella glacialis]